VFTRIWLPMVFGYVFIFVFFTAGPGPRDALRDIGLCLAVFGLAGVIAARYSLGRSFSVMAKATELVTSGLYSRIRNPIYVFSWFFVIGVVMMMRFPLLYLVPIVLIPIQIARARNESRVLEEKFGEEYRRYRASTWF
jgi:protein-S-isoprenylcysteine O-methyltransferase Ste14